MINETDNAGSGLVALGSSTPSSLEDISPLLTVAGDHGNLLYTGLVSKIFL